MLLIGRRTARAEQGGGVGDEVEVGDDSFWPETRPWAALFGTIATSCGVLGAGALGRPCQFRSVARDQAIGRGRGNKKKQGEWEKRSDKEVLA